jgi:hypothetical protein
MRRKVTTALVLAMMSALMFSAPASAQGPPEPGGHLFCSSGEVFAHGHITPLAQEQGLGPAHGHTPGFHQGFATCNPAGVF